MCYSARIIADYRRYVREFGAILDLEQFVEIFWHRRQGAKLKIPKGVEAAFLDPQTDGERQVKAAIDEWASNQQTQLEQELFKQSRRLADAERTLQTKTTKKAQDAQRIATAKIEQIKGWLADLQRTEHKERDARIYPGVYAPVMIQEGGRPVVKLMRYQCRPAGKPAFYDTKFPGTYNARRDNLEGFWKGLFGRTHGLILASAFYEHVDRDGQDVVLEFKPQTGQDMLVACLYSHWTGPDSELWSFAAVTDDPPPEVAAAGHDRCIIPIKAQNAGAWLNPDPADLQAQYRVLDDRERPYYEHRLAA